MREEDIASMRAIELGRALRDRGYPQDAAAAFALALDDEDAPPEETMEAAAGVLELGGDYRPAYDGFLRLYRAGHFREDILSILTEAFYAPNAGELRARYERNRKVLSRYPYLFQKDFPDFDALPLRFYPYDDGVYIPFVDGAFGEQAQPGEPVVRHWFFRDLENPILASDVFSQYELEYLNDTVRRSEDVGRENHIYLHYTDWETFCAWCQVLEWKPLLKSGKLVFLIGDERAQYPIDFAARFGVDYSQYPLKPVGLREVNRLIWHTQLSTHNGGDFFNEIFDCHPNLVCLPSVMLSDVEELVGEVRKSLGRAKNLSMARQIFRRWENPAMVEELYRMKRPTDKDLLVAMYLGQKQWTAAMDPASRIAPALFFQPHFPNIAYTLHLNEDNTAYLESGRAEEIRRSSLLRGFKYVKTFTPMRRFTTSYGGAMQFMLTTGRKRAAEANSDAICPDVIVYRALNRSFMVDPEERLFKDSVIVRLEDGKLNPKATFTALAAFLDVPYTESMTYCSEQGERNPHANWKTYAAGFDLSSIYKTYDQYINDAERCFLEYCLRDAYAFYGYDFQWYDGKPMDDQRMRALIDGFTTLDRLIREDWEALADRSVRVSLDGTFVDVTPETPPEERERILERHLAEYRRIRPAIGKAMSLGLRYVTKDGRPLRMTPLLALDPALLEHPLYH